MANIHSQKKRILRAERERLENRRYTSAIKTYFRRLEGAIAEGDAAKARVAMTEHLSTVERHLAEYAANSQHREPSGRAG